LQGQKTKASNVNIEVNIFYELCAQSSKKFHFIPAEVSLSDLLAFYAYGVKDYVDSL